MSKGTVKTEIDLEEILEELRSLNEREDALRMQVRQLSEERRGISVKLAKAEEALEASTLNGLREPPEELREQATELEEGLHKLMINWHALRRSSGKSAIGASPS